MSADVSLGVVQTAIYQALSQAPELAGVGVHDEIPEPAAWPYIVVGEAIEQPDNTHNRFGWQTLATLHIWSRYEGFAEANAIASHVTRLLDHQPLDVSGRHHVVTRSEFAQTLRDPEPGIRHVVLRFRIFTERESHGRD